MRNPALRMALAALIGAGIVTAAVGVRMQKFRFVEKRPEHGYVVESEDGHRMMNIAEKHASTPEQAVTTAEEIALLKQQGQRELVGVCEVEVNGQLDHRTLSYKYHLADGRTMTVGERDPDDHAPNTLTGERYAEASRLMRQGTGSVGYFVMTDKGPRRLSPDGKVVPTFDRVIQGRTFTFEKHTFTLSDGTQVAWSIGVLRADNPAAGIVPNASPGDRIPDDLREWAALRQQGKGELVGVKELIVRGELDSRTCVYRCQLSDGRIMDQGVGVGGKFLLSTAQRKEWAAQARDAGLAQDLGTHEDQYMGRTFIFTRQRFVLSDGTEVIWSVGKLKDSP